MFLMEKTVDDGKRAETENSKEIASAVTVALANWLDGKNSPLQQKSQVVKAKQCPSWTPGIPIEIYVKWVTSWDDGDKSDYHVKYLELIKHLSENKVIPGLKDYMKNIVLKS